MEGCLVIFLVDMAILSILFAKHPVVCPALETASRLGLVKMM